MDYFHAGILIAAGALTSGALTWAIIPVLRRMHTGQNIREEGPSSHLSKAGTPTMGGVAFIIAVVICCVVSGAEGETGIVLAAFVLFGALGLVDDYMKVAHKHNLGLRAWQKFSLQILIALLLGAYQSYFSIFKTTVWVPFINEYRDFGIWFIPFIAFVIVAMANSVNLTDGLDGLAAGVTSIVALFFAFTGVILGFSGSGSFFSALTGACLGFLLFNKYPAKVFMGDTGSLALGGGVAMAAIAMKMELLLPVAGIVYVAEALSVIIQVISFKTTGKRVFLMSPLHHHFELLGMSERQVVGMFWVVTSLFCAMGLKLL